MAGSSSFRQNPTRVDLPAAARKRVAPLLQARLADVLSLALAFKQAHWAVRGPSFAALHELFDELAGKFLEQADDLAERLTALGVQPRGTVHAAALETTLDPYSVELTHQAGHLEALASQTTTLGKAVRGDIDRAARMGDAGSADLFTQMSREADKALWMLEAHIRSES